MIFALPLAIGGRHRAAGLVLFVQLLYLESLRLRTRDLPRSNSSKKRWKTASGLKTEEGAACFSLIKHTSLLLLGILYFCQIQRRAPLELAKLSGKLRLSPGSHAGGGVRACRSCCTAARAANGCCRWCPCCG